MRAGAGFSRFLLAVLAACGPTFAFAPWRLPVPDSARQIGYSRAAMQAVARPPIEFAEVSLRGASEPLMALPETTDQARVEPVPFGRADEMKRLPDDAGLLFVTAANGDRYVGVIEQYQVFAYRPDGSLRWALQTDSEAPASGPVIGDIKIDGHGHLYVFPYIPKDTAAQVPRPVDVFSEDGEHLYSGLIRGRLFEVVLATGEGPMLDLAWQAAEGDTVWGLAAAPAGGYEVVRYRLNEPF